MQNTIIIRRVTAPPFCGGRDDKINKPRGKMRLRFSFSLRKQGCSGAVARGPNAGPAARAGWISRTSKIAIRAHAAVALAHGPCWARAVRFYHRPGHRAAAAGFRGSTRAPSGAAVRPPDLPHPGSSAILIYHSPWAHVLAIPVLAFEGTAVISGLSAFPVSSLECNAHHIRIRPGMRRN